MKNLILFSLICISLLVSCGPTKVRKHQAPEDSSSQNALSANGGLFTPITDSEARTNNAGFEHCNNAATTNATHIGGIKSCQNTIDRSNIRVQFINQSATNNKTCVIPTYYDANYGNIALSTLQGARSFCFDHTANQIMAGVIRGDDSRYLSIQANSIIIIKESLLNSFYACVNAPQATKAAICGQFKQNYKDKLYLTYNFPR